MATQKRKFDLFQRLGALGFTYEEAQSLYRIELTLHRWAEAECNGEIQREEDGPFAGQPFRHYDNPRIASHPIADREAGALKRLANIIALRNARTPGDHNECVIPYHQTDARGCALYLLTRAQLTQDGKALPVDQYYNRGLAVCA